MRQTARGSKADVKYQCGVKREFRKSCKEMPKVQVLLDKAEYGVGSDSLRDAMAEWAAEHRTVHFTNVSRLDTFDDCVQRYYWDYSHGGTGVVPEDTEAPHALVIGTAIHDAAEVLLNQIKLGCAPLTDSAVVVQAILRQSMGLPTRAISQES
jgi:hypothetical protein